VSTDKPALVVFSSFWFQSPSTRIENRIPDQSGFSVISGNFSMTQNSGQNSPFQTLEKIFQSKILWFQSGIQKQTAYEIGMALRDRLKTSTPWDLKNLWEGFMMS
jgi:hypothetical protein